MQKLWIELISMQLMTIGGSLLILSALGLTVEIIRSFKNE